MPPRHLDKSHPRMSATDTGNRKATGNPARWPSSVSRADRRRLDQCAPHGLAIYTHALRDRPHRDTAEVETHRFGRFIDSEPRTTTPDAAPGQMSRHRGAMHAVPVSQLVDRRAVVIVIYEPVDLGGGEKGLKILNPPNHSAPRVLRRGGFRALRHPVDAPLPACDQGLRARGKVCERTTQGPRVRPRHLDAGAGLFSRFPWSEGVSDVERNGDRIARTGVGSLRDRVRVVRDGDSGAS